MNEPVIIFDRVGKCYPLYHHITGGIKNFLFSLPKALHSLQKSRHEALRDVSFEILRGETFGIIGRNGAGKSTALGLMAGVLRPTTGSVTVKGRISPLLELGAGFHPELTGRENLLLNGVLMGLTRAEVLRRIDAIIDFSGLAQFIEQPIRVYSSGMYARLGFSAIMHFDPEILLVDELLSVGDIDFKKKCLEKMIGFKRTGVTIVFVSHGMRDVADICDRVAWLEDRVVKRIGPAQEVLREYQQS
jgi:lipopolysaccharide transport system ATP-binding protein